jgi:hypothetical protein
VSIHADQDEGGVSIHAADVLSLRTLLHDVADFLEEEAENRAAAGSEMSDYAREPRELQERVEAMLAGLPEANRPLAEVWRPAMNETVWQALHPAVTREHLGAIVTFIDVRDPRSAREQLDAAYKQFGGFRPIKGFTLTEAGLEYPGDPTMRPMAECRLREERVILHEASWVAVVQPDGSFEVARMD